MSRALRAALLSGAFAAWPAIAGDGVPVFADADTLRNWCLGRGTVRATCVGYLVGVVDALRDPTPGAPHARRAPCLPPKMTSEQIRLLFLNHVHEHPEVAMRPAAGEVRAVLDNAFGCAEARPRGPARVPLPPGPGA